MCCKFLLILLVSFSAVVSDEEASNYSNMKNYVGGPKFQSEDPLENISNSTETQLPAILTASLLTVNYLSSQSAKSLRTLAH